MCSCVVHAAYAATGMLSPTMETHYSNIGYIRMPFIDRPLYRKVSEDAAKFFKWNFNEIEGDLSLMERFIAGDWDAKDFLVLEPGETAAQSYDDNVIKKAE